jgi:meso-butanediol dehydrogenase/(S,S)-butanediol dehydrogenase/diacetyl reductase
MISTASQIAMERRHGRSSTTAASVTTDEPTRGARMGRLDGKIAVITGTSSGQGRCAALSFAGEGATVIGCGRDGKRAEETVERVRAAGGEMHSIAPFDLCDPDAVAAWIDDVAAEHGGIDVLYNNAGEPRFGPIDQMSVADWDYTVHHELDIVFYTCRAAWPHLAARKNASIVNVASIAGTVGVQGLPQSAHAATKMGIVGITRQLAAEGAPLGIRVNAISPGLIDTPATDAFIALGEDGPLGSFLRQIPLGRAGLPEEVVPAAVFLASDEASYITGVNLLVDGGSSVLR